MRSKMSQKEIVVRYLAARMGEWTPSYQIVKQDTDWGWLGIQADRRALELAKEGKFESSNYTYYIEARRNGKYAEFRVAFKTPRQTLGLKDWTHGEPNYQIHQPV